MAVVLLTYNKYEYTYSWTVFGNTFRSWACLGMYAGILSPPPPSQHHFQCSSENCQTVEITITKILVYNNNVRDINLKLSL